MMNLWSMTDTGLVRKENQDAYAVKTAFGHTICVVCDGMGGAAGGQLASRIAVDTFSAEMEKRLTQEAKPDRLREISVVAVALANRAVRDAARTSEAYHSMGTTLVSAVVREGEALLDNVGDSRAYLIRAGGGISRITRDHSVVERLVEQGSITEEEARSHPNRNIITRALGPDRSASSDSYRVSLEPGDSLLLCTDGLTGTVRDQELAQEIHGSGGDNQCLDRLLELAKAQGAPDNVTAVLLRRQ